MIQHRKLKNLLNIYKESIFLAAFLILFSCASSQSQNNISFLFKRWKIDYIEMNGEKVDKIGGEKIIEDGEFEYEFRKDKTYTIFSSKGIDSKGKWEWNDDETFARLPLLKFL